MSDPLIKLRFVGLANGDPHEITGHYLISYDVEWHLPDGSYDGGNLVTTPHPAKAALFTPFEAFRLWHSSPSCKCHHWRQDGQENRPLSAFTVEVV
jgi:hypothetical protein